MIPISVCIIAKNEEANIERCLSSLAPYGFEIVVVDTGSTDRTKEIAAKYTDRIFDFEWTDNFSEARNYSLRMASNNWIFMMDCDEWIDSIDIEEMNYFRKKMPEYAGSITRKNITGDPGDTGSANIYNDRTERLFSRKHYYYTGAIHEQLTPKHGGEFKTLLLNTFIGHTGYFLTPQEQAQKAKRNLKLLFDQMVAAPGDPYVYFQIGKSFQAIDDFQKAIPFYEKALSFDLDPSLAYVTMAMVSYGKCLLSMGQVQKALDIYRDVYDSFTHSADFIFIMGLIYMENQMYEEALDEFQKATTFEFSNTAGTNSYQAYHQIGRILSMAGEREMAIKYFELCGDFPPALEELQILKEAPEGI